VGLTVVASVEPSRLNDLRGLLEEIGRDPAGNPHVPFGQVDGVHYARLLLLEPTNDLSGRAIPEELIFMADFDAPLDAGLEDLFRVGEKGLVRLMSHCAGFPAAADRAACKAYFLNHVTRDAAYYVNTVGLGVAEVVAESRLRDALGEHLDASPELRSGDLASVRGRLASWVAMSPELRWALERPSAPDLGWRVRELIHLLMIPLIVCGSEIHLNSTLASAWASGGA